MSTDINRSKSPTRRAFLGWWIAGILTATVAAVVAPLGVYLFPPGTANRTKQKIRVSLATPVAALAEGAASRFDAPTGMAFVMADGGEQNAAGDPTFGGFLTRDQGRLRAFAMPAPWVLIRIRRWQEAFRVSLPWVRVRPRWQGHSRSRHQPVVASHVGRRTRRQRHRRGGTVHRRLSIRDVTQPHI